MCIYMVFNLEKMHVLCFPPPLLTDMNTHTEHINKYNK